MSELISQAEYARRKGWSRPYITQLVQAGRITLIDGQIDPDRADAAIAATASPAHAKKDKTPAPQTGVDYLQARTMNEAYRAQKSKLEFEVMLGKLVDREHVEKEAFEAGHATREVLLYLPAKIAHQLSRLEDPLEIQELLEAEINRSLENLTQAPSRDEYTSAVAG